MYIKGTPHFKGWLYIDVLKALLNENAMRKYVGQQMEGFSVVELRLFSMSKETTPAKPVKHLHKVSLNINY
jgi:hypothetical protein